VSKNKWSSSVTRIEENKLVAGFLRRLYVSFINLQFSTYSTGMTHKSPWK